MANLRSCLTCRSHSQAGFIAITLYIVDNSTTEPTIARLHYDLGGCCPSKTTYPTLSYENIVSSISNKGSYLKVVS